MQDLEADEVRKFWSKIQTLFIRVFELSFKNISQIFFQDLDTYLFYHNFDQPICSLQIVRILAVKQLAQVLRHLFIFEYIVFYIRRFLTLFTVSHYKRCILL